MGASRMGLRGIGGINVTFIFSSGEIPKTQWEGLVSLALRTKKPQFYISGVIILQKQAGLNSEENKQTTSFHSSLTNLHCVLQCYVNVIL